jgi:single-strand DNA-binding protein
MASDINRVILIGRLTRDPEFKTVGQNQVAKFSMAVNDGTKEKEHASFVDCELWGKGGEIIQKYATKGMRLCVEGALRQDRWEKEGKTHSRHFIRVQGFQFLDSKKQEGGNAGAASFDSGAMTDGDTDIPF